MREGHRKLLNRRLELAVLRGIISRRRNSLSVNFSVFGGLVGTREDYSVVVDQARDSNVDAHAGVDDHKSFAGAFAGMRQRANWTETVPGKSWFAILRLYGPLEPWFDKTWRPGEFELMN